MEAKKKEASQAKRRDTIARKRHERETEAAAQATEEATQKAGEVAVKAMVATICTQVDQSQNTQGAGGAAAGQNEIGALAEPALAEPAQQESLPETLLEESQRLDDQIAAAEAEQWGSWMSW